MERKNYDNIMEELVDAAHELRIISWNDECHSDNPDVPKKIQVIRKMLDDIEADVAKNDSSR